MLPWNTQFEMECLPQAPRLRAPGAIWKRRQEDSKGQRGWMMQDSSVLQTQQE